MANRTTAAKVKTIIDTDLEDAQVEEFITDANRLVDKALNNSGLSEDLLTSIEKWFTAHLIASSRERMAKKEGAGGVSIEYAGTYGQGLASTPYGQQVKALDPTGRMSALGGGTAYIKAL
jgi:hypothetical protein